MGRTPLPAAMRLLNGNASKRPIPEQPDYQICEIPPQWLSDEAKLIWSQVAPVLSASKVLTEADINAMGRYCHLLVQWLKLADFVAKNGTAYPVYERVKTVDEIQHPDGRIERKIKFERVQNGIKTLPQARQYMNLNDSLLRIEAHFGMTPSSRAKVALGESGAIDPAFDDSDLE